MRNHKKRKVAGAADPPHEEPVLAGSKTLRAANDNGRGRRTVVLLNFENMPLQAGEVAVVDALMQTWSLAANDNSEAVWACTERKEHNDEGT